MAPGLQFLAILMLKLVAVVVALISPSFSFAADLVSGTGISYNNEDECKAALPKLNARLLQLGLKLMGKSECLPVDGEPEAYAPSFNIVSNDKAVTETALGVYQPSKELCLRNLKTLLKVAVDNNEAVIEAGCGPLTITDLVSGDVQESHFQPMIVLVKR